MSQTQEDKQQVFREKLQTEGTDGFADGPRPWEHWDESGNQDDNRIWEGTARRVYPKQSAKRGFGDRLLSGLAVIALGSMMVGIAGVYLSTPSTQQQAVSIIQPPPIVASRDTTQPATQPAESADTAATAAPPIVASRNTTQPATQSAELAGTAATAAPPIVASRNTTQPATQPAASAGTAVPPVLARLDTLSPPAAGTPAAPAAQHILMDQTMAAARTAPVILPGNTDKVAVETVITEEAVTTKVYTRQPSQEEAELVAAITTTTPPFTSDPDQSDASTVTAATEILPAEESEAFTSEAIVVAQTETATDKPPFTGWEDKPASEPPVVIEQLAQAVAVPAPAVIAQTGDGAVGPETGDAVVALNAAETDMAEPEITRELETATQVPVLPEVKTGNWVINLSSYTHKSMAKRKLAEFRQKGVDSEIFTTTINDKPMHRIRVTGFRNARSAKAEISALEQLLDLEGAWVSRR
jgi:hypothetical protein